MVFDPSYAPNNATVGFPELKLEGMRYTWPGALLRLCSHVRPCVQGGTAVRALLPHRWGSPAALRTAGVADIGDNTRHRVMFQQPLVIRYATSHEPTPDLQNPVFESCIVPVPVAQRGAWQAVTSPNPSRVSIYSLGGQFTRCRRLVRHWTGRVAGSGWLASTSAAQASPHACA